MTRRNPGSSKRLYGAIAAGALVALAAVLWATREGGDEPDATAPATSSAAAPSAPSPPPAAAPEAPRVRRPSQRIADKGRLRIDREALRDGDVLALGLDLPDEARGHGPRPVKIVDVTGRVLDLEGLPVDGAGSGLRLEIDPEWLVPGRYLVQVGTQGSSPLAVRRYVLEVTDGALEVPESEPDAAESGGAG